MSKRPVPNKSEQTKARLLEAALRLFAERGFEKTTMRAIATEAKLAAGSAYYHFSGKDAFVFELFEQSLNGDRQMIAELAEQESRAKRLESYVAWKITTLSPQHEALGQLMGRMLTPRSTLSPFGEGTTSLRDRETTNFGLLLHGRDNGGRENDIETQRRARVLWLVWMAVLFLWLHDEDRAGRDARAQTRFGRLARWVASPAWTPVAAIAGKAFDAAWIEVFVALGQKAEDKDDA